MAAFRCAGSVGLVLRCSVSGQNTGRAPLAASCAALLHSTFCGCSLSRPCVTESVLGLLGAVRGGGVTKLPLFLPPVPAGCLRARQGLAHRSSPEPSQCGARRDQRAAPAPTQPPDRFLYSIFPSKNCLHCFIKWYCSVENTAVK